jgi:hypothetical protein
MRRACAILLALLATTPAAAAAPSCLEVVDQLSRQFGLDTSLPTPGEYGQNLSDTLKESGGVMLPPDKGAPVAVQPPAEGSGRMATAPPVGRDQAPAAARHVQMESLLTAARTAGQRGNERECAARLAEAQQLAESGR